MDRKYKINYTLLRKQREDQIKKYVSFAVLAFLGIGFIASPAASSLNAATGTSSATCAPQNLTKDFATQQQLDAWLAANHQYVVQQHAGDQSYDAHGVKTITKDSKSDLGSSWHKVSEDNVNGATHHENLPATIHTHAQALAFLQQKDATLTNGQLSGFTAGTPQNTNEKYVADIAHVEHGFSAEGAAETTWSSTTPTGEGWVKIAGQQRSAATTGTPQVISIPASSGVTDKNGALNWLHSNGHTSVTIDQITAFSAPRANTNSGNAADNAAKIITYNNAIDALTGVRGLQHIVSGATQAQADSIIRQNNAKITAYNSAQASSASSARNTQISTYNTAIDGLIAQGVNGLQKLTTSMTDAQITATQTANKSAISSASSAWKYAAVGQAPRGATDVSTERQNVAHGGAKPAGEGWTLTHGGTSSTVVTNNVPVVTQQISTVVSDIPSKIELRFGLSTTSRSVNNYDEVLLIDVKPDANGYQTVTVNSVQMKGTITTHDGWKHIDADIEYVGPYKDEATGAVFIPAHQNEGHGSVETVQSGVKYYSGPTVPNSFATGVDDAEGIIYRNGDTWGPNNGVGSTSNAAHNHAIVKNLDIKQIMNQGISGAGVIDVTANLGASQSAQGDYFVDFYANVNGTRVRFPIEVGAKGQTQGIITQEELKKAGLDKFYRLAHDVSYSGQISNDGIHHTVASIDLDTGRIETAGGVTTTQTDVVKIMAISTVIAGTDDEWSRDKYHLASTAPSDVPAGVHAPASLTAPKRVTLASTADTSVAGSVTIPTYETQFEWTRQKEGSDAVLGGIEVASLDKLGHYEKKEIDVILQVPVYFIGPNGEKIKSPTPATSDCITPTIGNSVPSHPDMNPYGTPKYNPQSHSWEVPTSKQLSAVPVYETTNGASGKLVGLVDVIEKPAVDVTTGLVDANLPKVVSYALQTSTDVQPLTNVGGHLVASATPASGLTANSGYSLSVSGTVSNTVIKPSGLSAAQDKGNGIVIDLSQVHKVVYIDARGNEVSGQNPHSGTTDIVHGPTDIPHVGQPVPGANGAIIKGDPHYNPTTGKWEIPSSTVVAKVPVYEKFESSVKLVGVVDKVEAPNITNGVVDTYNPIASYVVESGVSGVDSHLDHLSGSLEASNNPDHTLVVGTGFTKSVSGSVSNTVTKPSGINAAQDKGDGIIVEVTGHFPVVFVGTNGRVVNGDPQPESNSPKQVPNSGKPGSEVPGNPDAKIIGNPVFSPNTNRWEIPVSEVTQRIPIYETVQGKEPMLVSVVDVIETPILDTNGLVKTNASTSINGQVVASAPLSTSSTVVHNVMDNTVTSYAVDANAHNVQPLRHLVGTVQGIANPVSNLHADNGWTLDVKGSVSNLANVPHGIDKGQDLGNGIILNVAQDAAPSGHNLPTPVMVSKPSGHIAQGPNTLNNGRKPSTKNVTAPSSTSIAPSGYVSQTPVTSTDSTTAESNSVRGSQTQTSELIALGAMALTAASALLVKVNKKKK